MMSVVLEKPACPVCEKPCIVLPRGVFHCGMVRLLSNVEDHYLAFEKPLDGWPTKGCPICGRPMKNVGKFEWLSGRDDGLERMGCLDQRDHYCYVTKEWYEREKRSLLVNQDKTKR